MYTLDTNNIISVYHRTDPTLPVATLEQYRFNSTALVFYHLSVDLD